jgi:ketosteroid isomerase-like protein
LARRWFDEVINGRDLDAVADIYAPDYVYHGQGGLALHGPAEVRAFAASILAASEDRHAVVEQQFASGDFVVTRFTSRGTLTGPWQGVEPAGQLWTTEGIDIGRVENGKIAEDWEVIVNTGV